ncbi:glycosyltransferase [Blastopirellula marina]|uniref:Glycosyl transferase family 1 n=1 Tax=Blastopirellula marina TaxID=124 RepID=A0A2S8FH63_9BACT|nr:glycosyltransferase [Blastopirellula marina]PQO31509.1 glycosyl transferase family 1 [Blastopirellula marina]PTL42815.1 glycosyl transferase family 1 [Blastopirellula marina]
MQKLMLIIPTLDRSGAEKQLTLLAKGLPRDRFDVSVCALTRGGPYAEELKAAGIPVTVIGKKLKVDPPAYWRLKRHIQQVKPDIVHTWLFAANSYGRKAAFATQVPHVLCGERCVDPWKITHEHIIDRYLDRKTDKIVVNSTGIVDFYTEKGRDKQKFVVIPNGIDLIDGPPTKSKEELWEELRLPPNAKMMLCVGRLWPQKRMKDLIWATEILKRIRDDAFLVIVGDGPQRERLIRYTEQVTIDDKVRIVGQRSDVSDLMKHATLFMLASGYEGQSNALMEAMATGLPVAVSDIPGNRDLVKHDENGYLVGLGQRTEYSRFANFLLEDEPLRKRFAEAARKTIAEEFSIQQMIDRHAALYESL